MKYGWLLVLWLWPALSAASPAVEKTVALSAPIESKTGKRLFGDNGCALCHGEDGSGTGPMAEDLKNKPRNFRDYAEMHRMPDVRMEQAIREGLPGTAMPAFPDLGQKEIEALVRYIRSFMTDSMTEIDMCLFETAIIGSNGGFDSMKIALDEPDKLAYIQKDKTIRLKIKNWGEYIEKKSWRTHFRIMKGNRIHSLVTVKVKPCFEALEELVQSLPCKAP